MKNCYPCSIAGIAQELGEITTLLIGWLGRQCGRLSEQTNWDITTTIIDTMTLLESWPHQMGYVRVC